MDNPSQATRGRAHLLLAQATLEQFAEQIFGSYPDFEVQRRHGTRWCVAVYHTEGGVTTAQGSDLAEACANLVRLLGKR